MSAEKFGTTGWVAIAAGVAAFDFLAPETLSSAFRRGRESESPAVRIATIGALAITTAHLMGTFDALGLERYDPFNVIDRKYHGRTVYEALEPGQLL